MTKPSKTLLRALTIIRDYTIMSPSQFGSLLWGRDHPGYRRSTKAGPYGSRKGGGMDMAAGGYLGKLRKRGLISHRFPITITDEGLRLLREKDA